MKFKASLDNLSKVITYAVSIIFLFLTILSVYYIYMYPGNIELVASNIGMIILFVAVLLFCYLLSPQSYVVENDCLIIERQIRPIRIMLNEIKGVKVLEFHDLTGLIRTFGNGGLFGYYGRFYSRKQGKMTLYTTRRNNRIMIITKADKKIIISPDDLTLARNLKEKLNIFK